LQHFSQKSPLPPLQKPDKGIMVCNAFYKRPRRFAILAENDRRGVFRFRVFSSLTPFQCHKTSITAPFQRFFRKTRPPKTGLQTRSPKSIQKHTGQKFFSAPLHKYRIQDIILYYVLFTILFFTNPDSGFFIIPDTKNMNADDPAQFWTRFQALSGKDLPVIIKTGIKQSTLSTWRSKKTYPRAGDAVKIAGALQTTVEYLVTGSDKTLPPLDPAALEIALTVSKLPGEAKHVALAVIRALAGAP
jgi:hypothetical protein